jgi:hypothetical protein
VARTRVKLNHGEMSQLLKSAAIRADLTRRALPVLAAAKADPHDDTYEYENGLRIEQATTDRAVVRVVAGDRKGFIWKPSTASLRAL